MMHSLERNEKARTATLTGRSSPSPASVEDGMEQGLVHKASNSGQRYVKRDGFKMRQSLGPLVHKATPSKQTELYKAAAILFTCLFLANGITYSVIEYGILGNSPHPNQEKKSDEFDIKYSDIVQSTIPYDASWRVTDTFPTAKLDDEQFSTYSGYILWITVLMAGLGLELIVWEVYLRDGWSSDRQMKWKIAQFFFPLFGTTTLGLATTRNYLALMTLVPGLWKFGFPETLVPMYTAITDSSTTRRQRVAWMINSSALLIHHGAASLAICMLLSGTITPTRHVVHPCLCLMVQHWFILAKYVNRNLYIFFMIASEIYFEFVMFSVFEFLVLNHWTASLAGGTMLVAHWLYFITGAIDLAKDLKEFDMHLLSPNSGAA